MNLQTSINILQNRSWKVVYTGDLCYIHRRADQHLILPIKSTGRIPSGTLEAIFSPVFTAKKSSCQTNCPEDASLLVLSVILEKQGKQIWGRVEQKDMLAIACGPTAEAVAKKLSLQLSEFGSFFGGQHREKNMIPGDYIFNYQYDLTRVRELFQQLRINTLAEQANISQDLLGQFMMSKQYPSPQQAQQIEVMIQQFGREMLNFSLL